MRERIIKYNQSKKKRNTLLSNKLNKKNFQLILVSEKKDYDQCINKLYYLC